MDTLLSVGLNNVIGAALLALPAAALGRLRRLPALAHGLWLLVLLKLISPPLLAVPLPAMPVPEQSPKEAIVERREPVELPPEHPRHFPEPEDAAPLVILEVPPLSPPDPPTPPAKDLSPTEAVPDSISWQTGVVTLWLTGSLLWWLILAVRLRRFHRVLRRLQPAPESLQEQTRRLAGLLGLRRTPEVGFVNASISPLLWGLAKRPRLLLPAALWERLGDAQRETLLVHELAHLRRRDHWVRVLELIVLSLYWWNPVAWLAIHGIQQAEEQCCDAWVVWALPEKAEAYATALLETVSFLSQARSPLPVGASGIGKVHFLKRRLTMILRDKAPRGLTRGGLIAVLLAGALLLPLVATPAEPSRDEGEQTKTTTQSQSQKASERAGTQRPDTVTIQQTEKPAPKYPIVLDVSPSTQGLGRLDANNQPPAASYVSPGEIQKLRDQIELMEVQVQVKSLQVQVAQKKLGYAKRDLSRLENLGARGVVSAEDLDKAKERFESQEMELRIKEAELREPMVILQQARRRLASLEGKTSAPAYGPDKENSGTPSLFHQSKFDFGKVVQGTKAKFGLPTHNDSKWRVQFKNIRVSSAAIQAFAEPEELAPGKSGKFALIVDTSRFAGPKTFQIYVLFDMLTQDEKVSQSGVSVLTVQVDSQQRSSSSTGKIKPDDTRGLTDQVGFPPTGTPGKSTGARVKDLEQKLDRLLKEMDDLRRELKSRQPDRQDTDRISAIERMLNEIRSTSPPNQNKQGETKKQ